MIFTINILLFILILMIWLTNLFLKYKIKILSKMIGLNYKKLKNKFKKLLVLLKNIYKD